MSIWKEIKYALNSTLGKKSFVPLDELIKSNRHFVAGNETLFVPKNLKPQITSDELDTRFNITNIKFLLSGEIKVRVFGYIQENRGGPYEIFLEVEKNGVKIFEGSGSDTAEGTNVYSDALKVDINDELSIFVTVSGSVPYNYPVNITPLILGEISDIPITNI